MIITILLIIGLLLLLAFIMLATRRSILPWIRNMKPSNTHPPEWIAPTYIVEAVKRDYVAFYRYASRTLTNGWVPYARNLDQYLCGEILREQRETLEDQMQQENQAVDVLRAHHQIEVRHFSPDGESCLVIDLQTERRMATYDFRNYRRIHTQHIDDAVLVYRMRYDRRTQSWKIAEFIQSLPPITTQETTLPQHSGRDQ